MLNEEKARLRVKERSVIEIIEAQEVEAEEQEEEQ